jgi:hypothetical protein
MMAHRFASEFPAERVIRQRLDPPRRTYEGQQPARSAEAESLFRKGADHQHPSRAGEADRLRGEIAALRQQQADDAAQLRRAVAALAVRFEAQEQRITALAEKAEAVVAELGAARATDARPEPEAAPAAETGPIRKIDGVERALAEHGPCTARALATRMGWSQGSVGANLRHLVVRGRVRYTEPPGRGEAWVYEVAGAG